MALGRPSGDAYTVVVVPNGEFPLYAVFDRRDHSFFRIPGGPAAYYSAAELHDAIIASGDTPMIAWAESFRLRQYRH